MTENDLYYLRSIYRNLVELRQWAVDKWPGLPTEALADNIDWLDCFIDKHERASAIEAQSAETEGLGPKDESAVRDSGDAQP